MQARALLVDDDAAVRGVMRRACEKVKLEIHEAERGDEGLRLLEGGDYQLLVSDYMMPGIDGIEFASRARVVRPNLPILLVTGYATVERAVRAMQAGVDDLLEKPFEFNKLIEVVNRLVERSQKEEPKAEPAQEGAPAALGTEFVSRFEGRMREMLHILERASTTDCTVLVHGESGTGKELVARAIHDRSSRRTGPFVPVNCGAIPESLLESELFGHVRGAFSGAYRDKPGRFALANGGTLFLDEIGEMSPSFQVKLLRVIQDHSFEPVGGTRSAGSDFRLITATHRDLNEMIRRGSFREDLFFRLNVIELQIPPLRERIEDLRLLIGHFVQKINRRYGLDVTLTDRDALQALERYPWPGNVRELENLIERLCILQGKGPILFEHLPPHQRTALRSEAVVPTGCDLPEGGTEFYRAVEEFENRLILQALERTQGNKNKAATLLSLNRTTLVEKLRKKGMLESCREEA
jgi:DNA-binding NtrC family response regulator